MKSYIKTSRFVQPKRATKLDSVVTNESSPTSIVADVALRSVKIEDVLSNLEQVCDSSTAKWDVLRRMEDREHAMMQGLSTEPNVDRVSLENTSHANGRTACDNGNGSAHVLSQERRLSQDTRKCIDGNERTKSCAPIHNANKRSFNMAQETVCEWLMFAVWMMVFIGGLWISAELRATQRRDPAIILGDQ
jgi:hypothetical protein